MFLDNLQMSIIYL